MNESMVIKICEDNLREQNNDYFFFILKYLLLISFFTEI